MIGMKGNEGNYKNLGLRFRLDRPDEADALKMLDTMKRNQADFVTFLIKMFNERNHIDVENITKEEIKAIMKNETRIITGGGSFEFVEKPARSKKEVPDSVQTSVAADGGRRVPDEDDIDSDMFSQLDAFA